MASAFIVKNRWLMLLLIRCKSGELCEQAFELLKWVENGKSLESNGLINAV